ncbi:MAG TPA: 50S ribosomal protein L13 [Candidatus Saccharimonadales bacterium]|nr:50S ribosomal protein L13 [Candidatus Saccharimonadales bacterium]
MRTAVPRESEIQSKWYLVDAEGQTLGRMAANIATVLRGKHRPIFTPHMDLGDHVVVINASRVHVSGRKLDRKAYFRHSMYPGGARFTPMREILEERPERLVVLAVRGMLPKNRLGRALLKKLKVYAGAEHPHQAQQLEPVRLTHLGGVATRP